MDNTNYNIDRKFLSTDLSGFVNHMVTEGFNKDYVSLLALAPKVLFQLFGSIASLTFLKNEDYKSNFGKLLKDRFTPLTLRRYLDGIQHYHNYLILQGTIKKTIELTANKTYVRKVFSFYNANRTPYFHDIEKIYLKFMTIEKDYCAAEIRKRLASYKKLVSFLISKDITTFKMMIGTHIIEFSRSEKTYKTDWNYLKYFLKFAYRQGYMTENFSSAFLSKKNLRKRKKRFLDDEKIELIVASFAREKTTEKRDFSMINLMAKLGLRPSETIRIKLKHIDWVNSRILICGKDNKEDWLPLTQGVVEPIIDYLKVSAELRQRPEYLFLSERPPFKPLKTHRHLSRVLSEAYQETEIQPPCGSVRLNVFRHSIATSIVNRKGQNFFTAQSLLRHSSPKMTMNYAKFHSKRHPLFELDWPEKIS